MVSGNRGLRQPRLVSQTLQSLSLCSCSNLDCLYLSCPQLQRLQASPSHDVCSCCVRSFADRAILHVCVTLSTTSRPLHDQLHVVVSMPPKRSDADP